MTGWGVVAIGYALAAVVWVALIWLGLHGRRP